MAACAVLAIAASGAAGQAVRFDGSRVVRVDVGNMSDLKVALALTDDVWSHRTGIGGPMDIRVTPVQLARLAASGARYSVLINDVQAQIDRETAEVRHAGEFDGPGWFLGYHDLAGVRTYARSLSTDNPGLAHYAVIGQSLQGKDIFALSITGPGDSSQRVQILLNGGQHAREWVSVSTVMYIADRLIAGYGIDPRITALMDNIEFLIVPVVNPDGYDYTWTTNRLWRKNLRDVGSGCTGVDTNRNWGYQWGGAGAASNPCDETYRGAAPFSEPETQVMRDYTIAHPRIRTAVDFHSYSQLIMSPWGYVATPPAQPDGGFFNSLTSAMREAAVAVNGVPYTAGPVYTTIYPASGIAVDWWYGGRSVYGLTIELRDTGSYGFMLPPEQIIPTGEENLEGVKALADFFMPVRFSMPAPFPLTLNPDTPTTVQVSIAAGSGTSIVPGTERMYARLGASGPYSSVVLTPAGGTLYQGVLPATPCGVAVQAYFEATSASLVTLQFPGAQSPFQATPYQQSLIFHDDMEIDRGWTVDNDPSLTSGAWVRADPVSTFNLNNDMANPEDDFSVVGVNCFATQNGAVGGAAGLSDVDDGPTRLVSPVIDLSGAASGLFTYARWCYSANGSPDLLVTEVSNDNGETWTRVDQTPTTHGWKVASFVLPATVPPTSTMRVRFSIADSPNDSLTEAGIDEVFVYALVCPTPPCYANCDDSPTPPVLTANDFQCFLNAFAAGQSHANCDGSTVSPVLTANDFQCFVNAYSAGCR